MVGITLAYALFGPTSNKADEQNDIGPMLYINVGPTKLPPKMPTLVQRIIAIWELRTTLN